MHSFLATTLGYIVAAVILAVLSTLLAILKGRMGEKAVGRRLRRLPKERYRVLDDVILPTRTGTTQIDHLVLSIYGIFVVETKAYKGWIYGGENQDRWTQNIYGQKTRFYNPILQNAGHVRALERVLREFGTLPFYPIVAFSPQADLKVNVKSAHVIYWTRISSYIRSFTLEKLSLEQVNAILERISEVRIPSTRSNRKAHVGNVRKVARGMEEAFPLGRCPRCGGRLVERTGKYGSFLGCSNYPRCRYTQNENN